ncbi:dTMP kinase [Actinomyces sp. F1_1611]
MDQLVSRAAQRLRELPRGMFIALEGGDGSGKTTQINLLRQRLEAHGANVLTTFEPGATPLGHQLRELVMHGPEDVDPRTEALLYAADRAYHVATMIRPALAAGTTVITDRYLDSSVAYQGIGRGLGEQAIRDLSLWATDGLLPDAVIVLNIDPEVGLSRRGEEKDRLERAGDRFHEQVARHYQEAARLEPGRYRLVDANGSVEETFTGVVTALLEVLGGDR